MGDDADSEEEAICGGPGVPGGLDLSQSSLVLSQSQGE